MSSVIIHTSCQDPSKAGPQTSRKSPLRMSLLLQTIYQSHREIQRAADIKNGDYVWVASPDKNELVLIKVKTVGLIQDSGLFNPHTGSGNIVVDGILALTFTESLPPQPGIHKIVTAPAALLYRLTPSLVWANKINSMLLAVFGVS